MGGTKRLDAERPEKLAPLSVLLRGAALAVLLAALSLSTYGSRSDVAPAGFRVAQVIGLVALVFLVARFTVRLSRQPAQGLLKLFWRAITTPSSLMVTAIALLLAALLWSLSDAFPSSSDAAQLLAPLGSWLFIGAILLGVIAGLTAAKRLARLRLDEYDRIHMWGNGQNGILKAAVGQAIDSPEMHKAVHFDDDSVRIYPVPAAIAAKFSGIEVALTVGHVDAWMLDEQSTPDDIRFVPTTAEGLERRATLRASNFTLVGFDDREVPDEEILKRRLDPDVDLVRSDASSPAKPRAALAAESVTERDLPQIQSFAAERGTTIVGYDLKRWNPERARFEKLIYMQKVTAEEGEILQLVANRTLKGQTWNVWGEFHWVDNAEEDRDVYPKRIDSVVFKRSPIAGIDPEKRIPQLELVVAMMPKGSDGWAITDAAANETVTLRYGKKRSLPPFAPYDFDLPVSHRSIPFAVTDQGQLLCLSALESNALFGGSPGGGKSGGLTAYLAGVARLTNTAIVGLDPKRVEQSMWRSRFSRIAKDNDSALDVLERLEKEMRRRYVWLEGKELKKLTVDQMSIFPMIVLVIDELADLVASGMTKEERERDGKLIGLIRSLIALGRASGIVVIAATQKPQSDVIPTAIRDLIQQRVGYATTTAAQTDTVLGAGMASNGALAHEIAGEEKGVCYVVNESSRTPTKAKTFWVPDEDVKALAESTAHLRIQLDWLDAGCESGRPVQSDLAPSTTSASVLSKIAARYGA